MENPNHLNPNDHSLTEPVQVSPTQSSTSVAVPKPNPMKWMFIGVGSAAILIVIIAGSIFLGRSRPGTTPVATITPSPSVAESVACTLEAKICPDGSAVGRTGPNCEFAACPTSTVAVSTATPVIESTSPQTLTSIPLVSTAGWRTETYKGISFMLPPSIRLETPSDTNMALLYRDGSVSPDWLIVEPYEGGSRREQYLKGKDDCHWIINDALFGTVNGLQIAGDPSWCQGGWIGGIVTVVNNNFVTLVGSSYDPNTKIIRRDPTADTIFSTVKAAP